MALVRGARILSFLLIALLRDGYSDLARCDV